MGKTIENFKTQILLVRHGYSLSNRDNTFTGQLDIALSPLGEKQAELCCDYILSNYKIDKIYSSDLSRAINTIKKVSDILNLPINLEKNFREIYGGEWEGMEAKKIFELYPELQKTWSENIGVCRCPKGESLFETGQRAYLRLKDIAIENYGKTILVATHAGVIRGLECIIRNLPATEMKNIPWVANASLTKLSFENGLFIEDFVSYDKYLTNCSTNLKAF